MSSPKHKPATPQPESPHCPIHDNEWCGQIDEERESVTTTQHEAPQPAKEAQKAYNWESLVLHYSKINDARRLALLTRKILAELERVKGQLEQERAAKIQWAQDCRKAAQQRDELLAAQELQNKGTMELFHSHDQLLATLKDGLSDYIRDGRISVDSFRAAIARAEGRAE